MLTLSSIEDIAALSETSDIECKLAAGRDGRGMLPKGFWETYSAFANSYGGEILLGLEEKGDRYELHGISDVTKVQSELWDLVNNRQKISANLLKPTSVRVFTIDGKQLLHVHVLPAQRKQRPVYVNGNPLTGTYKRRNTGDYLCDEETVRRLMAEQVEDSRDNELLRGYGFEDLNIETFNAYRQLYAARTPDHPWNAADPIEFLRNIGGWRVDRDTGRGMLTRAGLLMFGQLRSIQEVFPLYMLDYQEREASKTEARWIDRLTLDGSWSGNLFDFYRRVIQKLTADLKVPFALKGDQRQEDTQVHQALREALVNTLVHADYSGRASVLVVKRPDLFGFRNPGLMRVPVEIAIHGSESDCRNRLLQQMFRYVGLGEQAGSGVPKIYQGWRSQHWRAPLLIERETPSEQTLLGLRMLDLLPEAAVQTLRQELGNEFVTLSELERLILVIALTEEVVSHRRMGEVCAEHAHDLTIAFQRLTKAGWLVSKGHGRGTVYHRPGQSLPDPDQLFGGVSLAADKSEPDPAEMSSSPESPAYPRTSDPSSGGLDPSSGGLDPSSGGLDPSSGGLDPSSGGLDPSSGGLSRRMGLFGLEVAELDRPIADALSKLDPTYQSSLRALALPISQHGRCPKEQVEAVVLSLCQRSYLTLGVLAELLDRSEEYLRKEVLNPLVAAGRLRRAFPSKPNDPRQAYATFLEVRNVD